MERVEAQRAGAHVAREIAGGHQQGELPPLVEQEGGDVPLRHARAGGEVRAPLLSHRQQPHAHVGGLLAQRSGAGGERVDGLRAHVVKLSVHERARLDHLRRRAGGGEGKR